jgi:phosphoribosyl-AMP cyclohydrolase
MESPGRSVRLNKMGDARQMTAHVAAGARASHRIAFPPRSHLSLNDRHDRLAVGARSSMRFIDQLRFNADGLIPAIIQETGTGRVLMMAWMNRASLEKTVETGLTHFWSRSRQRFWMKGETSGHIQRVKDIALDCDGDTLLIQVEQIGSACHEGYKSCFFRSARSEGETLEITEARLQTPEQIYGRS